MQILQIVTFCILAVSVWHGVRRLFQKRVPMYFQLLTAGVGCFALSEVTRLVGTLQKTGYAYFSVSCIGAIGCFLFLLSANYGQLDGVVDDRGIAANRNARLAAVAAPVVILLLAAVQIAVFGGKMRPAKLVSVILVGLPAAAASYYNLKHLLLPVDDFGFLRATRACNLTALLLYVLCMAGEMVFAAGSSVWAPLADCCMHLAAAGMILSCERGVKRWGTLF